MATKPAFRQHDAVPKRADDIHLKMFGQELDASGTTVVIIVAILGAVAAMGFGLWLLSTQIETAAKMRSAEHTEIINGLERFTCVMALDVDERKDFRRYGWYCGDEQRRGIGKPQEQQR